MSRSFDSRGTLRKGTPAPANRRGISRDEAADPSRLSEALRDIYDRLGVLEARAAPEATEYVLDVGTAGAITRLYHGFGSSVRWTVCHWSGPNASWALVQDDLSDPDYLVLRSYQAGRVVLRIEPSQFSVT